MGGREPNIVDEFAGVDLWCYTIALCIHTMLTVLKRNDEVLKAYINIAVCSMKFLFI